MAIAAKISSTELRRQMLDRFGDAYLEARLIYAAGVTYEPGITDDANFLTYEVPVGTGGYQRQVISYDQGDVTVYSDNGVGLSTRATTFTQDGSNDTIDFTHVVLVWSGGNVLTVDNTPSAAPTAAVDGTYTNIPIDSTSADGVGLTVDLQISNSGATSSDYFVTVNQPGRGYTQFETVTINDGTLAGLGAITGGAGSLTTRVTSVVNQSNEDSIMAVAATAGTASLNSGNQAVFYWNPKLFGFYSTSV